MGLPVAGPAFVAHLPRAHAVLRRQGAILLVLAPLRSVSQSPWPNFIGRLSWDSSAGSGQLSRRRAVHPSTDMASKRPLPRDDDSSRFGDRAARLVRVFRPRGFAPPRRFPPLRGLQACCILLPIVRFAAFRSAASGASPEGSCVPAARFVPPEGCSPLVAVLHHRSRCPLAVRGRRSVPADPIAGRRGVVASVGFEALLHRRVRSPSAPLLVSPNPILPGLCSPSRFLFETGAPRSISRLRRSRVTAAPSSVPHPRTTRDRGVAAVAGPPPELASAGGGDRAPWGRSLEPRDRIGRRNRRAALIGASLRHETRIGEAHPCGRATESDPVGIPPEGSGSTAQQAASAGGPRSLSGAEVRIAIRVAPRRARTSMGFLTSKSAPRSVPRSVTGLEIGRAHV